MKFRFQRKHLSVPYVLFLVVFVLIPILLIVFYAFTDTNEAGNLVLSLNAFKKFFTGSTKFNVIVVSLFVAIQTTIICLIIAYPLAYFLASKKYNRNAVLVMLFVMPMWINFVLRTGATRDVLFWIGINGGNAPYLATLIGMVYNYLPFCILPLHSIMLKLDHSQMEAAADLGASPIQVFIHSVIPQSMHGVVSAVTMTLMPVMSSYVISDALSEGNITLIGNSIYINFINNQWHNGSFTALFLLILVFITLFATRFRKDEEEVRGGLW